MNDWMIGGAILTICIIVALIIFCVIYVWICAHDD